jgi:TonB family protein
MSGPPAIPGGWTRGRFWRVAGVLCVAQAGLILLFGGREQNPSRRAAPAAHFRLLGTPLTPGQLTRTFFATDPTVFLLPNLHGFSARGWLRRQAREFEPPPETEPPAWLTLDTARLGAASPPPARAASALPFGLAAQRQPELDPWPASLAPELVTNRSRFEIQGELAGRLLNAPASLPAWPASQLLGRSTVQIAVDAAGQVITARLLAPRSGSADADNAALAQARQLRFRPVSPPTPVWGKAVFDWQTAEPANVAAP